MRSLGIALVFALTGAAALAQQAPPTLVVVTPNQAPRVDVEIGAAEINTHAARIRVAYLPRMAPLPGTLPHSIATMPNAFDLLGTQLPYRFSPSSVAGLNEPNVTMARNAAATSEPLRRAVMPAPAKARSYSAK